MLQSAQDTLPVANKAKRPWLSADTLYLLDKKRDARLNGSTDEWRRYKSLFKARSKADLDQYYNSLADQADEGLKHNNLRSVFRAIKSLSTSPTHARTSSNGSVPI